MCDLLSSICHGITARTKLKTSNTSKFFILVLLCKNRRTTTLHSKLLYSRLEEENFHSIIVLLSLQNRKSANLFSIPLFPNLKQGKFIQQFKHSFINFRMAISSQRFRFLDGSLPTADSPYREDWIANNHLIVGWIKQTFKPKIRSSISACKIARYGTFIKLPQWLVHELLLPPDFKIVQSYTCYHVWAWGRVLEDLEDWPNPTVNINGQY